MAVDVVVMGCLPSRWDSEDEATGPQVDEITTVDTFPVADPGRNCPTICARDLPRPAEGWCCARTPNTRPSSPALTPRRRAPITQFCGAPGPSRRRRDIGC